MPTGEENKSMAGKQEPNKVPETLDIYKASFWYKLKQKIKMMTPRKKLMYLVLPILAVAIGLAVYMVLAAPGDPEMRLVDDTTGGSINNQTLQCGQTYSIRVVTDTDPANNSNQPAGTGVVTAGAFIEYDPNMFSSVAIDSSSSAYSIGEAGVMELVDPGNNLIQIIRGEPTPGISADNQTLAIITATVADNVSGATSVRFYRQEDGDPEDIRSSFVLDGGDSTGIDCSNSGDDCVYSLNIDCATGCSGDICETDETCPNDNWEDESAGCCAEQCVSPDPGAADLYLDPASMTVNSCQDLSIRVMMRSGSQRDISSVHIELDMSDVSDILESSSSPGDHFNNDDIVLYTGLGTASSSVNVDTIEIDYSDYTGGPRTTFLATLNFRSSGDTRGSGEIVFDQNATAVYTGMQVLTKNNILISAANAQASDNIVGSMEGGNYTVIVPEVEIDADDDQPEVTVLPNGTVYFNWDTNVEADCVISGDISSSDSDTTEHSFTFSNLTQGTSYTYNINCSADCYSDLSLLNMTFTVPQPSALVIRDISVSNITAHSADVSWYTSGGPNGNGRSDTRLSLFDGSSTMDFRDGRMVTSHAIHATGLMPNTFYRYTVESCVDGVCAQEVVSNGFTTELARAEADANMLISVTQDRICDKWLYCEAAVEIYDSGQKPPKKEEVCFSVGLCDQIDEGGNCISIVPSYTAAETYNHPDEVDKIRNLSGYSKVGLNWGGRCLNNGRPCSGDSDCGVGVYAVCKQASIDGYYPYTEMREVGVDIGLANSYFENGTTRPWRIHGNAYIENIHDPLDITNRVLKIEPRAENAGAEATNLAPNIETGGTSMYVISFRAKAGDPDGQRIAVSIGPYVASGNSQQYTAFSYYNPDPEITQDYIDMEPYWREYVMTLDTGILPASAASSPVSINFVRSQGETSNKAFYIDNVSMKSVLEAGDNVYLSRSCRLYPTNNAPSCDYYDSQSNKDYKGWKGYCVEEDPGWVGSEHTSLPMCLQWWPVDIVSGESNVFTSDRVAGYTGRKPLYYCLEASGNYGNGSSDLLTQKVLYSVEGRHDEYYNLDQKYEPYKFTYSSFTFWELTGGEAFFEDYFFNNDKFNKFDLAGMVLKGDNLFLSSSFLSDRDSDFDMITDKIEGDRGGIKYYWQDDHTWVYEYRENPDSDVDIFTASSCSDHATGGVGNFLGLKFLFSSETLELDKIVSRHCDDTNGSGGNTGSQYADLILYLREPCMRIAKVVDEDGNTAPWLERINSNSINDPEFWIGYNKKQDYTPYGSAVVPDGWIPEEWEIKYPLMVEPPDTATTHLSPYQLRAGSPYGVYNAEDLGRLDGENLYNLDFFGPATCVSGPNIGDSCVDGRQQCGMDYNNNYGICAGFKNNTGSDWKYLNEKMVQWDDDLIDDTIPRSEFNLSQLFARSYGIWEWARDDADGEWKYLQVKLCSGGSNDGGECFSDGDCPDGECNIEYGWDITNTGVEPRVNNLWVDDTDKYDFIIIEQGAAVIKFDSWVDPNQVPLVKYMVQWGDGFQSSESGLRIGGRPISNPHILVHYYEYDPSCDPQDCGTSGNQICDYCIFKPEVTLEDNWGKHGGKVFDKSIIVYSDASAVPVSPAIMAVNPDTLSYVSSLLPQTNSFRITNSAVPNSEDLNWYIESVDGFLDAGSGSNVSYTLTPGVGSGGVLRAGGIEYDEVSLVINNIGTLNVGHHEAHIYLNGNGEIKPVLVNLDISQGPDLEVDINNLDFTATRIGTTDTVANNNQTFEVQNQGGGTLNWTATPDQMWIRVSPGSGSNDETVTVTIDETRLSTLALGTHTGTIEVVNNEDSSDNEIIYISLEIISDWWNSDWQYKQEISYDSYNTGELYNAPILVRLDSSNFDFSHTQANGEDLRFISMNTADCLPADRIDYGMFCRLDYEIEDWRQTEERGLIWVRLNHVFGNASSNPDDDIIYVYYGNSSAGDAQNASSVWNSADYLMVHHLKELTDSSGNGYNAVALGDTSQVNPTGDGYIDGATSVDDDGYLEISNNSAWDLDFPGAVFTAEFWINAGFNQNLNQWVLPMYKGAHTASTTGYDFEIYGDQFGSSSYGQGRIEINVSDGPNRVSARSNTVVMYDANNVAPEDGWHYVVGVCDRASQSLSIYVDGQLENSSDISGVASIDNPGQSLELAGQSHDMTGYLDEVRITDGAVSGDWINFQYCTQANPQVCVSYGSEETIATGGGIISGVSTHQELPKTSWWQRLWDWVADIFK